MAIVTIKDKTFRTSISESEIKARVAELARQIDADYKGKSPVFVVILNGAFIFAADLLRETNVAGEVSFVKVSSYAGTSSTGTVKQLIGLNIDVAGRPIVIIEDIVDSGLTMKSITEQLAALQPESINICTLFLKPDRLAVELDIRYVAFQIPNDFIVGYGLDYDQQGRQLKEIYTVVE